MTLLHATSYCRAEDELSTPAPSASPSPRGVVIFLIDTLRTDRLSVYGHNRDTTPALRALAKKSVVFERAISNSAWTLPAMVGFLTGRYPTREVFDRHLSTSLVEQLPKAGFATAAFTEGGFFTKAYGMDAGFETYLEEESAVRLSITGAGPYHKEATGSLEKTFTQSRAWLRDHHHERFFLVIHTYHAHSPYRDRRYAGERRSRAFGKTFENFRLAGIRDGTIAMKPEDLTYLADLYDGGVAAVDERIAEFLSLLLALGVADTTVVVATSDHGEDLGVRTTKRAGHHGHTLYDEQVRVPLLIHDPTGASAPVRITTQVRLIDVMPTVLDLLNLDLPPALDGKSLLPLMRGAAEKHRLALSWTQAPPVGLNSNRFAVSDGRYKLTDNGAGGTPALPRFTLFDLKKDPGERENLYDEASGLSRRLMETLRRERNAIEAVGHADYQDSPDLVDSVRERLRSLGYIRD